MGRIARELDVVTIREGAYRTMFRNKVLRKHVDFKRPVLLSLDASDYLVDAEKTGHVGFVVAKRSTAKLHYQ